MSILPDHAQRVASSLNDPERYVRVPNVAIFDEHVDVNPLTNEQTLYDLPKLQRIVQNRNTVDATTGSYAPLMIGHTQAGAPEWMQPPIVGFAKNTRIDKFGDGRHAIYQDWYIDKKYFDIAMTYPRRSIELLKSSEFLDAVSLLRRAPKRHMGLLTFEQSDGRICYSIDASGYDEVTMLNYPQQPGQQMPAQPGQAPTFAPGTAPGQGPAPGMAMPAEMDYQTFCNNMQRFMAEQMPHLGAQMQHYGREAAAPQVPGMPGQAPPAMMQPAPGQSVLQQPFIPGTPGMPGMQQPQVPGMPPQQLQQLYPQQMAYLSGTNGQMPQPTGAPQPNPEQYSAHSNLPVGTQGLPVHPFQQAMQTQAFMSQFQQMQQLLDQFKVEKHKADVEKGITQLFAEGYVGLDYNYEVETGTKMSPEQFAAHISTIRRVGSKAPTGLPFINTSVQAMPHPGQFAGDPQTPKSAVDNFQPEDWNKFFADDTNNDQFEEAVNSFAAQRVNGFSTQQQAAPPTSQQLSNPQFAEQLAKQFAQFAQQNQG